MDSRLRAAVSSSPSVSAITSFMAIVFQDDPVKMRLSLMAFVGDSDSVDMGGAGANLSSEFNVTSRGRFPG